MSKQVDFVLSPVQADFVAAPERFTAFIGGIGSGKTYSGSVKAIAQCARGGVGLVVAPTYRMLQDVTMRMLLDLAKRAGLVKRINKSSMSAIVGNCEVLFRSADTPDRLRGLNLRWAYIDEGADCDVETWRIVVGRLREQNSLAWITSTPRGYNWLYDEFVARQDKDYRVFRASTFDNPYLPDDFVKSVSGAYAGAYARQELHGEFVNLEGEMFRREYFRIADTAPVLQSAVRYWDVAASASAGADYSVGVKAGMADDGTIYVLDVVRGRYEYPTLLRIMRETALSDGETCAQYVEAVGTQRGLVDMLNAEPALAGIAIRGLPSTESKVLRAQPVLARAEQGKLVLVRAGWNAALIDECLAFPNGGHDDQVDALSGALKALSHSHSIFVFGEETISEAAYEV